ncbi:ice-binding family protein [Flavobacterium sp. LB1P62]|uniref:ice-binding family protein n=1 Tax=Flavobacterium sp. LB1P62 TaxID=3401715 RepID=UPI003AB08E13
MKNITSFLLISFLMISRIVSAQVGIGTITPDISSVLDVYSNDKGVLLPRLSTTERDAIGSPANGLLMYNTTTSNFNFYNAGWKHFLTDIVLPANGGTGIANNNASTLTLSGAYATTITTTASTGVTLPPTGTLYGTATESITSTQILNSLTDETGTGNSVFSTSPTFAGVPTAPTAANGTNTTQLATTAFVLANLDRYSSVNSASSISTSSTTDIVADGMTLIPGAGIYAVTFNSQYAIASGNKTESGAVNLLTTYNTLMGKAATNTTHAAAFANETLTAGVYTIAAAGSASGAITLDGGNDPNAVFIFRFGAAFTTTASTSINLINGATSSNVFWIAEGAIGLGASNTMKGTLLSHSGAVTMGASSNLDGRMLTNLGAIGIDVSTITIPPSSPYIDLGAISSFAIFTSNGSITNAGASNITGDIGTNNGSITGFGTATVNGTVNLPGINNNALATFSVYQNGVLVANSSRTRTLNVNTVDISLHAMATVAAGQAIDIRWKVDLGTITLTNKILTLVSVR